MKWIMVLAFCGFVVWPAEAGECTSARDVAKRRHEGMMMRWVVLGFVGFLGLLNAERSWAGCVRPLNMDAAYKQVDPQNRLGADERALNAYAQLYNYRMNKGDSDGIWQIARPWQYYYMISKFRFDAIEEAANGAKPDSNLPGLLKIYANVPPEAKLTKTAQGISANWIDKSGKLNEHIIRSPQQISADVLGFLPENVKKFVDDFVAGGPPPGFQGECSPQVVMPNLQVVRPRPVLPDPPDRDRSLTCYTTSMGGGDSVTNCN